VKEDEAPQDTNSAIRPLTALPVIEVRTGLSPAASSLDRSEVPEVSSEWTWPDRLGELRVRWGFGRNNYRVRPGLYALGSPDRKSPVLVSANYKLSFDVLRRAMSGRQAWILVLDSDGVNVWCAAGKGTFATEELVHSFFPSSEPSAWRPTSSGSTAASRYSSGLSGPTIFPPSSTVGSRLIPP
jgi:hypothetical protein